MKHPFLKSILILGSVFALANCSNEAVEADNLEPQGSQDLPQQQQVESTDPAWLLQLPGGDLLIYPSGIVTDVNGNVAGTFVFNEGTFIGTIYDAGNNVVLENVDTDALTVVTMESLQSGSTNPASSAAAGALSSTSNLPGTSSATNANVASSSSVAGQQNPASSAEQKSESSSSVAQTVINNGNVTVTGNLSQTVAQGASTTEITFSGVSNSEKAVRKTWNAYFLITEFNNGTFYIKATNVPPYFEAGAVTETFEVEGVSYELKLNVTASNGQGNNNNNNQQEQKSSSSQQQQQPKSSSSQQQQQPKSSSSQQQQQPKSSSSVEVVTSGCPNITVKGAGGTGWATRYWDACKPSCSWKANAGGALARQCNANGKTENTDYDAQSVCSGGNVATCISQIPFTVDGCSNIGFAFAAVPASNGGQCGKCFQLTFTGTGHYNSTNSNTKALKEKGKKLVIMVTNVGTDVAQGQFDIMIPGGGPGIFNATSGYGWGSQGAQYGGLLSECESENNYKANTYKSCLTEKCNKSFSNDAEAKKGCLFLADFMEAAGNPEHEYVEVECPQVLKSRY